MKSLPVISLFFATIFLAYAEEQQLTVHVVTWNVDEKNPPGDLANLLGQLPENKDERPDIIILGLQEVTMSFRKAVADFLLTDEWSENLDDLMKHNDYIRVKKASMMSVVLNIYVKSEHAWSRDHAAREHVMTGLGGFLGNKGAVMAKFHLYGQSFCIVNAHFHADDKNLKKRLKDYQKINQARTDFCDYPSNYVIWLGDLNFRLDVSSELNAQTIHDKIKNDQAHELLEKDQLILAKKNGDVFVDFSEAPITFNPTYRMILNTGDYDLERRPAWTDRILYKSENGKEITPILYKSLETYTMSDHLPVQAQFKITVDTNKS